MLVNGSERNEHSLKRIFQGCVLPSFDSVGQMVSEEKNFQKSANQKQELSVAAMFNGSELNEHSLQRIFQGWFLPSFNSFGQAVAEENIFFLNQPIRNKNCLWWPCLLTDRDEMRNLYRGPAIYAPYKDSVHLATRFQRRNNRPIRNKNSLWWPFLLMDRDKMSNIQRRPSIDASY